MTNTQAAEIIFRQLLNNIELVKQEQNPITIELVGDAGMSKTAICKAAAKTLEKRLGKSVGLKVINGAELGTETGALNGFPMIECKYKYFDPETGQPFDVWLAKDSVDCENESYQNLNQYRTTNVPPDWVKTLGEYEYSVLILDDIGRSQQIIYNALMELILQRKYDSWTLPQNCFLFCTTNKDSNSQNVREEDDAQKTRKISLEVTSIDVDSWIRDYANDNLNSYMIEFLRHYWNSNLAAALKNNIRNYTLFSFAIDSAIKDFIKIQGGDKPLMYNTKSECLKDIYELGYSMLGKNPTEVFINEFVINLLSKITDIDSIYGKVDSEEIVERIKSDIKDDNILVANLQLRRVFGKANEKETLSPKDSEYLVDILSSGIFKKQTILYYQESIDKNPKKFTNVRNNGILSMKLIKASGLI